VRSRKKGEDTIKKIMVWYPRYDIQPTFSLSKNLEMRVRVTSVFIEEKGMSNNNIP